MPKTKVASTSTRVSDDILEAAAAVAAAEHRSAAEQVNHWARIGMQVERSASVSFRQILAVAAGEAQFSSLGLEERTIAHALIDARMAERAAQVSFGEVARKAGHVTVSIDDEGNLVEIAPDGTRRVP